MKQRNKTTKSTGLLQRTIDLTLIGLRDYPDAAVRVRWERAYEGLRRVVQAKDGEGNG